MTRNAPNNQARQEREELKAGLSPMAQALATAAEEESGLAASTDAMTIPAVPAGVRSAFEEKFSQEPENSNIHYGPSSWWQRSGPAFVSGMAAAAILMVSLFFSGLFQRPRPMESSWAEFRGHGLPNTSTERSIIYTFEGGGTLAQSLSENRLDPDDVRTVASEDELLNILDSHFDSVHIIIDEASQTIRGLVPSVTSRQVQDSYAPLEEGAAIEPGAVYDKIVDVRKACLVLLTLEETAP